MTSRARALAVFGAYLCLATHLSGLLHVLVVRHATCPGHGEVVHGPAPAHVAQAPRAQGTVVEGVPAEAGEESDEHCLLVATRRRELAGLTPTPQAIVHTPAVARLEAPSVVAAVTPRARLLLAPKTSPPAAAV